MPTDIQDDPGPREVLSLGYVLELDGSLKTLHAQESMGVQTFKAKTEIDGRTSNQKMSKEGTWSSLEHVEP